MASLVTEPIEESTEDEPGDRAEGEVEGRPQDNPQLAGHIRDMFSRARDARRERLTSWRETYRYTMNQTWAPNRAAWLPSPRVAEMHPILAALVGWQIDTQPAFDVMALADPNSPFAAFQAQLAADLKLCLRSAYHNTRTATQLQMFLWDAWLYGTGISKAIWDPRASGGMGDARLVRVDPFSFYPDPDALSCDDANYFIEYHQLSDDELRARYPDAYEAVRGASGDRGDLAPSLATLASIDGARNTRINPGALGSNTYPSWGRPNAEGHRLSHDVEGERHHILECWMRVPAFEKGKSRDRWRCVVICGQTILFDEFADDMWSHGQHPSGRYVPIEMGEFWPVSMAELLVPLQRSINRTLASIEHNLWLVGNPMMTETQNANTQRQRITNKPGSRITVGTGGKVEWLQPPQVQPQLGPETVRLYIEAMQRVSGLSAIVRGAVPTSRNSGGVMDSIQEAAFVRIRLSLHNLETHLTEQGEKLASLICEFYDEPRMIALIGPDGGPMIQQIHSQHFYLPSEDPPGTIDEDEASTTPGAPSEPPPRVPMRFQLQVQAGSNVATSRQQRTSQAVEMFAVGAIDNEALLSTIDFPNWQMIVDRMNEMAAQQGTLGLPPTQRAAARR